MSTELKIEDLSHVDDLGSPTSRPALLGFEPIKDIYGWGNPIPGSPTKGHETQRNQSAPRFVKIDSRTFMRIEGKIAYITDPAKCSALVKKCMAVLDLEDLDPMDRDTVKLLSETCTPYGDDLEVLERCLSSLKITEAA